MRKLYKGTWYLGIFLALVVCGIVLWRQKSLSIIYADNQPVIVEIAKTEKDRKTGLSYRSDMKMGHGMLFVFDQPESACMWMKDMSLSLDVYWYSAAGDLIGTHRNVEPSSFPRLYCPEIPASYMLEVNMWQFSKAPKKLNTSVNQ